jgi:hypothetical protein
MLPSVTRRRRKTGWSRKTPELAHWENSKKLALGTCKRREKGTLVYSRKPAAYQTSLPSLKSVRTSQPVSVTKTVSPKRAPPTPST